MLDDRSPRQGSDVGMHCVTRAVIVTALVLHCTALGTIVNLNPRVSPGFCPGQNKVLFFPFCNHTFKLCMLFMLRF